MPDNLKLYLDGLKNHKEMSEKAAEILFQKIDQYRNQIVEGNLRLVVKIAFEIYQAWKEIEVLDLIQEGNLGLIYAVDNFKYKKGYQFSTYATYCIKGYILNYIKSSGLIKTNTTKAQRKIFDNIGTIKRELEKDGADLENILESYGATIIDYQTVTGQTYDLHDPNIQDELITNAQPESIIIKNEATERLWRKIHDFRNTLSGVEKCIFDTRLYAQTKTLDDICAIFSMNYPNQVKRIESKIIEKAQKYFTKEDLNDIIER